MKPTAEQPVSEVPLDIVGGCTFGRNPKISPAQTFNMMITDKALVQTPGYKKVINLPGYTNGRGIYASSRGDFMIAVIDNTVFKVSGPEDNLVYQALFDIGTFYGDISIDENVASQIAICDQDALWVYNYLTNVATRATLPTNTDTGLEITPGFVTYHDGYFIVPDITSNKWYLSAPNNGLSWNWGAGGLPVNGAILTKPDDAVAVLRAPGRGNLIYVFGQNVTEMWNDTGAQLFPYQRNNSISIDYGCLSSNTIAAMDDLICWLGINEKSGPVIMVSTGREMTRLSTDGIDFKLAAVVNPKQSYAFFYKIDGHIFYQLTFYDPNDNFTLLYDFNTQKFSYLTDENMNFHISESVAFFNNTYYFVSLVDGSIYELNSKYKTYDYRDTADPNADNEYEIPRVRICSNIRQTDSSRFIANSLVLTVDQGNDEEFKGSQLFYITTENGLVLAQEAPVGYVGDFIGTERVVNPYEPRIDLSVSRDGGQTFGNFVQQPLNSLGVRKNKVIFWRLGEANDMSVQLRFWSKSNVTILEGVLQARMAP